VALEAPKVKKAAAAYGEQVDVDARYTGGVGSTGEGSVRARLIELDGRMYVVATFSEGDLDQALQARLLSGFRPDGVLVAPDRDR
jgi:hypothetical protein